MCEGGREGIAVFQTGFGDLSGEPLRDLSHLGDAAPLGYQPGDILTSRYIPTFFQRFNVQPDCYFRHNNTCTKFYISTDNPATGV